MDRDLLLENIVSTVKTANAFGLPIIHSTINVATGRGKPTVPELAELLADNPPIDRTTTIAWEDAEFVAAVRATGRRKLIACALWTEICMTFPAVDALREGYDVYPVVDAIGGTSEEGAPRRPGTGHPSGRPSGRLGRACRRAPAPLGSRRDGG
jgi:nicotinamidase-related amidase